MADLVSWRPAFFGIKPFGVIKGGFVARGVTGDASGSYMATEPNVSRDQFGAYGLAPQRLSATFVHQRALDIDVPGLLGLAKSMLPISSFTKLSKKDMMHNDACPDITVNAETFEVFVDGASAMCDPIDKITLGQRYIMR